MKIDSFDIFDVDIGNAWRRLPDGGWSPKGQARRILNEYDRTDTRLVGTFRPPEGLMRVLDALSTAIPNKDDPFGRNEREKVVNLANEQIVSGNLQPYPRRSRGNSLT